MKKMTRWFLIGASSVLLVAAGFVLAGCSTPASGNVKASTPSKENNPSDNAPLPAAGAQLWAQNCGHCHNIRSPGSYSDAQWEIAVLHMRVRANLTADEHKKILAFLKSAH